MCGSDLKESKMEMTFNEIKRMEMSKFKSLLKDRIVRTAFQYLKSTIRTKGKEIQYDRFKMSEYLLPNQYLSIDDKKLVFSLRSQCFMITDNENNEVIEKCICDANMDILHLYTCNKLNENSIIIEYRRIYDDKIPEIKIIVNRIKQSLKKLQSYIKENQDQKSKT